MNSKTKFQDITIDLDAYLRPALGNNVYNIKITRSKKDKLTIAPFFLMDIKFNNITLENVDNVVDIQEHFMYGAKCFSDKKIVLNFPDVVSIGNNFCSAFVLTNKLTFKFPSLEKIGQYFLKEVNKYADEKGDSEIKVQCDRSVEVGNFLCNNTHLKN